MNKKNTKPDIAKPKGLTKKQKKIQLGCFVVMLIVPLVIFIFIKANPLVFNESWLEHRHCMSQVGLALRFYSTDNNDYFPYSEKGYADGLGLASEYCNWIVTGPSYKRVVVEDFEGKNIPEELCGRVYIQGLKESDDCDIAILFDKLATPGGDHCHLPGRMWAPYGREVMFITSQKKFIRNDKWDDFAKEQIELLVEAGISREKAVWYYNQVDKE
jgi:hypothetical protein